MAAALVASSLPAGGCADEEELPVAPQGANGAGGAGGAARVDTCAPGRPRAAILTSLSFTRESPKGVVPGFDLDGVVSKGDDEASCNKVDFVSPEGTPGIDNQLASLIPDVEKVVGNAVDGLVQGAINDGRLNIMIDLDAVDDLRNDPCVRMSVQLGLGKPVLGTDGVIEGFQTFTLKPDAPRSDAGTARIENGVMTAGPFELAVPLKIFDVNFTVHVHKAMFRATIDEDGYMTGMFGGGVETQEIIDGVSQGAGVDKIIGVVGLTLKSAADMAPDANGKCQQISSVLAFKAVPAFLRR